MYVNINVEIEDCKVTESFLSSFVTVHLSMFSLAHIFKGLIQKYVLTPEVTYLSNAIYKNNY